MTETQRHSTETRDRGADAPRAEGLDLREHGRSPSGQPITLDRRLFMQLFAWGGCDDASALAGALRQARLRGVLYADVNDPRGVALLTFSEDPEYFVGGVRDVLKRPPFAALVPKPEFTMLGRTYAIGYEPDLLEALIERPSRRVLDPEHRWAVWYPLRRAGSFEALSPGEQRTIVMEHSEVGHAYGKAGYAFDVRLACHGLDKNDSDFVIGLVGRDLYPLSSIVQHMRKTRQTSLHLERLGPFFVGRVVWQSA